MLTCLPAITVRCYVVSSSDSFPNQYPLTTPTVISAAEVSLIERARSHSSVDHVPWKRFFTNRAYIALVITHVCSNYGCTNVPSLPTTLSSRISERLLCRRYYLFISWTPAYFHTVYGADPAKLGLLRCVRLIVQVVVAGASVSSTFVSHVYLSALPYVCLWLVSNGSGWVADRLYASGVSMVLLDVCV